MSSATSTQRITVTRTVQKTGPDGKLKTYTVKEEKKIVDGKEEVVVFEEKEGRDSNLKPSKNSSGSSFFSKLLPFKKSSVTTEKKPSLKEFREDVLKRHNHYRALHGMPSVKLCPELSRFAQEWADKMAQSGSLQHRPENKHGENIYCGMKSTGSITGHEVVDTWYSEVKNYDYAQPAFRPNTGHFTQVIWKGSKELGVGVAYKGDGQIFVVGNYKPAGNVVNEFEENVFKPIK